MIKIMGKHGQLSRYNIGLFFILLINFSVHGQEIKKYKKYIDVMNYVEANYTNDIFIYKDVWDDKIYFTNDYRDRFPLNDSVLIKKMEDYKIHSIDINTASRIEIELHTMPFFEKRKFIIRYLSGDTEKAGTPIDENTYFLKRKANTY